MSEYLAIITLLIASYSGPSNEEYKAPQTSGDNEEIAEQDSAIVAKLVHELFNAFDARDLEKMQRLLNPSSKIIHHNGVATNTQEMMEVIQDTNNWYP